MSGWVRLLALLAPIIGVPVAAWAHAGPSPTPAPMVQAVALPLVLPGSPTQPVLTGLQPATVEGIVLAAVGLGIAAALTTGRRRGRNLVCLGIPLVLVLIGLSGAVHSVHHLGDSQGADRCALAAGAEHVNGLDTAETFLAAVALEAVDRAYTGPPAVAPDTSLTPARGRAPPA